MLHNFIWDVGVDTGDRYNRVDVFLSCREAEFDGDRRDDFGDGERTSPLVVQLLHGAVRGVVLKTQPSFVSDLVLQCCLTVLVIIPLHVVHCLFECSLHFLLGTIQSPHKGVCSLHCQCPCRLYSQVWVLTGVGRILVHCKTHLQVPDSRVRAWSQQSCLRRDKIQYFGKVLQNSPLAAHKMQLNRAILTMILPCR